MARGKAEDAGGLTPAKDDNAAPYHFDRRTLPIFMCVDYRLPSAVFGFTDQLGHGAHGAVDAPASGLEQDHGD